VNRFFNEARAATSIRHPGIVEVFDFGYLPSGMAYLVMEFLDGEPLSRRLASVGRLDERTALMIVRGIASALAAAHAKGIVHRDLKPDNVFLVPDVDLEGGERAKLLDFGIAKLADSQRTGEASARTRTGAVMGTPTYMSPEQCRGAGEVDHRSDLYSLGCILYEMLTGRPPFVAEGIGEIIGAHLFFPPDPPRQHAPGLSMQVEALTLQLLAKKPEERIQSASELARLLGQGSVPAMSGSLAAVSTPATLPPTVTGHPSTMTGAPTTLSGAAAESSGVTAKPKRRAGWIAGLLAVAVAGGAAAVVALGGGGGGGGTAPAAAPVTADKAPVANPVEPAPPVEPAAVTPDAGVAEVTADAAAAAPVAADDKASPSETSKTTRTTKTTRSTKKHDRKGTHEGSGSAGPLIETDL